MEKFLPIVILHGWGADSTRFEHIKELLQLEGHQVWVPDLPGFGQEPDPDAVWGLDEYASWMVEEARSRNLDRFVLIGHSFGGSVAIKAAVNFPEKVEKLILVSSAGIRISRLSLKMRIWLWLVGWGRLVFDLPVLKNYQELIRKILYKLLGSVDYFKARGVKRESLKKILNQDIRGDLGKIKAPTLIIWAERDKETPLKWARVFHQGIAGSQLKVAKNANHVFPYYEPARFVDLIEDFLKA